MSLHRYTSRALGASIAAAIVAAGGVGAYWATLTPTVPETAIAAPDVQIDIPTTQLICAPGPSNSLQAAAPGSTSSVTRVETAATPGSVLYDGTGLESASTTWESTSSPAWGSLTVPSVADLDSAADTGVTVATILTRTDDGDTRSLTAGSCVQPQSVSWIVGGSADVGSSSELTLINPSQTPVTASVTLYGSTGPRDLPSGGVVLVPAGSSASVLLETGGLDDRPAIRVESDGAPIAAVLTSQGLDGETPAGISTITPGAAPAEHLTIPGVILDGSSLTVEHTANSPALRIVNPGDSDAHVDVSLVSSTGTSELAGATGMLVSAGSVIDVTLSGIDAGTYAVSVDADMPVAAAVKLTREGDEYPVSSGNLSHDHAWLEAARPGALTAGVVALPHGGEITPTLALVNTGDEDASIHLSSLDGGWSEDVSLSAHSTSAPSIPADVNAVLLSTQTPAQLYGAVVLTADDTTVAGQLIDALPINDLQRSQSNRRIALR